MIGCPEARRSGSGGRRHPLSTIESLSLGSLLLLHTHDHFDELHQGWIVRHFPYRFFQQADRFVTATERLQKLESLDHIMTDRNPDDLSLLDELRQENSASWGLVADAARNERAV